MLLPDGYNRHTRILVDGKPLNVIFRPATSNERGLLCWTAQQMAGQVSENVLIDFVSRHVVMIDKFSDSWGGLCYEFHQSHEAAFETLLKTILGSLPDSQGRLWKDDEAAYLENLRQGIRFRKRYPGLAKRSCDDCRKWWFKGETNERHKHGDGRDQLRVGPVLCETETGCPKGTYENQLSLLPDNTWALRHFMECSAIGSFPDDPIVKQNAAVIAKALAWKDK